MGGGEGGRTGSRWVIRERRRLQVWGGLAALPAP